MDRSHPYMSVPGSTRAHRLGCICDEQRPPRYAHGRPVWHITPGCPIHGLEAARRYLDDIETKENA